MIALGSLRSLGATRTLYENSPRIGEINNLGTVRVHLSAGFNVQYNQMNLYGYMAEWAIDVD